jgi:hypothetical protein
VTREQISVHVDQLRRPFDHEELFGLTIGSVESLMHHAKVDIFQTIDRQGQLQPTTKSKAAERYIIDRDLGEENKAT